MSNLKHTRHSRKNTNLTVFNRSNGSVPVVNRSVQFVSLGAFIRDFNFANPDWSSIPPDLFTHRSFSEEGPDPLTKQEKHLLGAIKLAYFTIEVGRETLIRKAVRTGALTLVISLISFITLIALRSPTSLTSPTLIRIREVSAATVSATFKSAGTNVNKATDEIVESTRSAIFRRNSL